MARMRIHIVLCGLVALLAAMVGAGELDAPIPILADGKQIDVEHSGHAAPFVGDFDGDGRKDLLVGEYYQGRLRIYRNVGTNVAPRFEKFSVFQDGTPEGCIWSS